MLTKYALNYIPIYTDKNVRTEDRSYRCNIEQIGCFIF